ncbi:MAG TPA: AmmeMemoRadiSam system protein B, partial [Bacteroidales bacterium]|nr:AmmeMemoRadiSam system protein B [Bacteroidales bacterium]
EARALQLSLDNHFTRANDHELHHLRALIVPHAGYVYSGDVAAEAYRQIAPEARYDTIIILAASHRCAFAGASIDLSKTYQTPLGTVSVNLELARRLLSEHPEVFIFQDEAHKTEHSLEVQLPFLQHRLLHPFRMLPIVIGSQNKDTCRALAEALRPLFTPDNLFIISSDFSHYPPAEEARQADAHTARAIASNDPEILMDSMREHGRQRIPGLATSLCGWSAVLTLLHLTREVADGHYHLLRYQHSGDQAFGDVREVVGYWAIAFTDPEGNLADKPFLLSREEKDILLMIARRTLEADLREGREWLVAKESVPPSLRCPRGVFVSLKKEGRLRGCIGRFSTEEPLYVGVQEMALAAASHDTRFRPLRVDELEHTHIEISVLGPLRKITRIEEIEPGRHGIYLRQGQASGTFLPQVAQETGWSREELLGHCARDKAGIGWNGWKEAEIYVYEAVVIGE